MEYFVSVSVNGVNSIALPMINQQQHLQEMMFSPFQECFSNLSITACYLLESTGVLLANHHRSLLGAFQLIEKQSLDPGKRQQHLFFVLPPYAYAPKD